MAFTKTWDETAPDGTSDQIAQGDDEIRDFKYAIRERLAIDHDFQASESGAYIGYHKKVSLLNSTSVSAGEADVGILHAEDVTAEDTNDYAELFYMDEQDNDVQITNDGGLNAAALKGNLPSDILSQCWPIGCLYINTTGVDPNTELGFGTWEAFGAGRVLVGYDSEDEDFDTAEETGGEKTHQLTQAELPDYTLKTANAHRGNTPYQYGDGVGGPTYRVDDLSSGGGDEPHNNLQPYIVVHMWKRTA